MEAGVDPLFEVAAEDEAACVADRAFESWFEAALANPPEGVARILRRRSRGRQPREMLRDALGTLIEHRDSPALWRRDPFDRRSAVDTIIEQLVGLGSLAVRSSWPDDYLTRNLAEIARFVEENARTEAVRGRDYDGLDALLRDFACGTSWRWKGAQRTRYGVLTRDEVLAQRDRIISTDLSPPVMRTWRRSVAQCGRRLHQLADEISPDLISAVTDAVVGHNTS